MTRPSAITRGCSLVVLAAVAALATGCGPGGSSASPVAATVTTAATPSTTTSTTTTSSTTTTTTAGADVATLRSQLQRVSAGKPYSAVMQVTGKADQLTAFTLAGRGNLHGPLSGRFQLKFAPGTKQAETADVVFTDKQVYVRVAKGNKKPRGAWGRMSRKAFGDTVSVPDPGAYAAVLLGHGPEVIKGAETVGGVATTRLSGHISIDEVKRVEPPLYDRLRARSVQGGFDLDVWLDGSGHVLRLEQWLLVQGASVHVILVQSGFASAITVSKPTGR